MSQKVRIDQLLFDKGLASSRERAKAMLMAGQVLIDDHPVTKAGTKVDAEANIRIKGQGSRFASRGGDKLESVLTAFDIDPSGKKWLDIGQSTGGFTDVLLQHGAVHVTGIDVGYGQLDQRLRNDPRVTCLERTNARNLAPDVFQGEFFDAAVIDVSFISLTLILPAVEKHIREGGHIIALVKPQFEAGREQVGKGGVVRDDKIIAACVTKVADFAAKIGLHELNRLPSPVHGPKGNREVFLFLERKPV